MKRDPCSASHTSTIWAGTEKLESTGPLLELTEVTVFPVKWEAQDPLGGGYGL